MNEAKLTIDGITFHLWEHHDGDLRFRYNGEEDVALSKASAHLLAIVLLRLSQPD